MATIKNNWLRTSTLILLGLVMAFGAQSFTNKEEVKVEKKANLVEWKYNGTSNNQSQSLNANNYSPAGSETCGGIEQTICKISAPEDPLNPGHPDMAANVSPGVTVADEITSSLSSPVPSTNTTVQSLRSF